MEELKINDLCYIKSIYDTIDSILYDNNKVKTLYRVLDISKIEPLKTKDIYLNRTNCYKQSTQYKLINYNGKIITYVDNPNKYITTTKIKLITPLEAILQGISDIPEELNATK